MISNLLQLGGDISAATRKALAGLELPAELDYDETDYRMPYSENQKRVLSLLPCLGNKLNRLQLHFLPDCAAKVIMSPFFTPWRRQGCGEEFCCPVDECGRRLETLELEIEVLDRKELVVLAQYCTSLRRLKFKVQTMNYPLG